MSRATLTVGMFSEQLEDVPTIHAAMMCPRWRGLAWRIPLLLSWVCVALLSTGCAELPPLVGPEAGGRVWHEYSTEHLTVASDLTVEAASKRAIQFERLYVGLRTARSAKDLRRPTRLIVFSNPVDFHQFAKEGYEGYWVAHAPGVFEGPSEAVFSENDGRPQTIFLHEIGHQFNHEKFFSIPKWLDEGLAEWGATLTVEDDHLLVGGAASQGTFGNRFTTSVDRYLDPAHAFSIQALRGLNLEDAEERGRRYYYAGAEMLVEMLVNGPSHSDQMAFDRMLLAMDHGTSGEEAFNAQFGSDMQGLEKRYRSFLDGGELTVRRFSFPSAEVALPTERTMTFSEIHTMFGELADSDHQELAKTQLALADALEPNAPEIRYAKAVYHLHSLDYADALTEVAAALKQRHDDPRFVALRASILRNAWAASKDEPTRKQAWLAEAPALLEHLDRIARTAPELNEIATIYAMQREPGEAKRYAEKAIAVDPSCVDCWALKVSTATDTSAFAEAHSALDRLKSLGTDGGSPSFRKRVQELSEALTKAEAWAQ